MTRHPHAIHFGGRYPQAAETVLWISLDSDSGSLFKA
jgi:hypothetical protein